MWWLALLGAASAISCKGPRNTNVDWFVVYKTPGGGKVPNAGRVFFYLDNKSSTWTQLPGLIGDSNQPVGATISQVYSADDAKTFSFMYNDDDPLTNRSDSSRGHAKGVVLFDTKKGFWMVHSAPNFPPTRSYSYPDTAVKYGQTFMCVSLPTASLPMVGDHLRYIQATPYYSTLPDLFKTRYPVLQDIVNKHSLPRSATIFAKSQLLQTDGGTGVMAFAKHKKFNKDIWLGLIAPEVRSPLAVQGWLNGAAGDLNTDCNHEFSVYYVQRITLPSGEFLSSKDHSKWAVGSADSVPVVCIGDNNRQSSQTKRGGGALCLKDPSLWRSFHSLVTQVEPCPRRSKNPLIYSASIVFLVCLLSTYQSSR